MQGFPGEELVSSTPTSDLTCESKRSLEAPPKVSTENSEPKKTLHNPVGASLYTYIVFTFFLVCIYLYIYIHIYIYARAYVYVYIYIYIHTMSVNVCIYVRPPRTPNKNLPAARPRPASCDRLPSRLLESIFLETPTPLN